jgi:predicted nucleic acid-binding protein
MPALDTNVRVCYVDQDDSGPLAAARRLVQRGAEEGQKLTFESERGMEVALQRHRESLADFADGLHIALAAAAGKAPLWTFDRGAARVEGAQGLRAR